MSIYSLADRVKETSTTTGTGTLTLAGAVTGFQSFAGVGDGKKCFYCIEAVNASGVPTGDWEVGIGTYTASGTTLSRDIILASSNSGSVVTLAAGTKYVFVVYPAAYLNNSFPGYMRGFQLAYSSTSAVLVGPVAGTGGICRDTTDTVNMVMTSQATVTVTTNAAINGNDSFQGPGTASTNSANATVTGSSTTFTTSFGTRALSGTHSNSGTTTMTGTGSKYLTEIARGDMIGNAATGYMLVTDVASDTSLTLAANTFTFTAATCNAIENPTIKVDTNTAIQVKAITNDTSLTLVANSSATKSGANYRIGIPAATTTAPTTNSHFMYIWCGNGSGGTGVYASTQRTTPFGVSTYTNFIRRVGTILLNAGNIVAFDQTGAGEDRWYVLEIDKNTIGGRVVTLGTATTWTSFSAATVAPPTAVAITINVFNLSSVGNSTYIRKRAVVTGDGTTTRPTQLVCTNAGGSTGFVKDQPCDGAQAMEYLESNVALQVTIDIVGWAENM